ncbi:MAG: rod shape-determining protein MreD, partial [Alphaproteobacteria bacterium]
MSPTLLQRLDHWARDLLPALLTVTLLVLSLVPVPVAGYRTIAPAVVLMSVYHWTVYRPDLLPPIVVFSLGIAHDLLTGAPFGTGPLTLLLVHLLVSSQRRFLLGKSFPIVWWGFGLVAAATFCLLWVAGSALAGAVLDVRAVAFKCLLTIAFYPVVAGLMFGV